MSASQAMFNPSVTDDGLPEGRTRQDLAGLQQQSGVQTAWWQGSSPSSIVVAAITALVVWVAVTDLLRQGRLGTVLSAGGQSLRLHFSSGS